MSHNHGQRVLNKNRILDEKNDAVRNASPVQTFHAVERKHRGLTDADIGETLVSSRDRARLNRSATGTVSADRSARVLRVDQGAARNRGDRLDGRHALSAAAVRLSLRGGSRIEAIRDLQGHGAQAVTGDYQSRD